MGIGSVTGPCGSVPPPDFRNQTFCIGVADMWRSIQRSAKGRMFVSMSSEGVDDLSLFPSMLPAP